MAEPHTHVFDIPKEQKVPLTSYDSVEGQLVANTTGYDTLKLWACACGATRAYDLERHTQ